MERKAVEHFTWYRECDVQLPCSDSRKLHCTVCSFKLVDSWVERNEHRLTMLRLGLQACMVLYLVCLVQADDTLWNSILEKRVENAFCSKTYSEWMPDWDSCYKTPNKYNGGDYRKENITSPTEVREFIYFQNGLWCYAGFSRWPPYFLNLFVILLCSY